MVWGIMHFQVFKITGKFLDILKRRSPEKVEREF